MKRITCFLLLLALCIVSGPVLAHEEGSGSFSWPIPRGASGAAGEIGSRFFVTVTAFERPSDSFEMQAPSEDEEYARVIVDIGCEKDRAANCQIHAANFNLAGDMGILYDNALDLGPIDVAPGEGASITVKALVNKDDSNLMLLFTHFDATPFTYPLVLAAEVKESISESIEIVSTVGMIARVGPSDNLDFDGVFRKGETLKAQGRNADGSWLEIQFGWVPAANIETEGDIMSLPVTFE